MTPADLLAAFYNGKTIAGTVALNKDDWVDDQPGECERFEILLRGYILGLRAALSVKESEGEIPF